MGNSEIKVFLSYAREDADTARRIYNDLKKQGIIPWFDEEDLLPGQKWETVIKKEIRESDFFLLLISSYSMGKRGFVQKEQKIAWDVVDELPASKVFVIPVKIDDCDIIDDRFSGIHIEGLYPSYDEGFEKILKVITGKKEDRDVKEKPDDRKTGEKNLPAYRPRSNEMFVGRKEILRKLLINDDNYFIFGARRIGKTSFLYELEKQLWTRNIPGFYLSIQGFESSEKIKRKIINSFRRNKYPLPSFDTTHLGLFDFLDELDMELESPIVFLIDEIEQIVIINKKESGFIDKLCNYIGNTSNIRFILTGSPHFKKEVADIHCSAFLSIFTIDILSVLEQKQAHKLIKKLAPGIEEKQVKDVINYTYYQPYLITRFMNKLYKQGKFLPPSDKLAQETYVTNALDGIFPNYFEGLNREYQDLVLAIHKDGIVDKNKQELKLKEIVQYGYLKERNGTYSVSNWFFNQWLKSTAPISPATS